tara:strand:+ start:706 stop:1320 length:615 start_codon:yes stop_codon:yes gene_type:complete
LDPTDFAEAVRQRAILDEYIKRQAVGRGGQLATVPMAFGNPFQRGWKNYTTFVDDFNKAINPKALGMAKAYGPLAVLVDAGLEMTDTDDPVAVNLAEGVGSGLGWWGGAAAGAGLMAPVPIPGARILGGLAGGLIGSGALKGAARGIYKAFDPEVDQRKALKKQERANELYLKQMEPRLELMQQMQALQGNPNAGRVPLDYYLQ